MAPPPPTVPQPHPLPAEATAPAANAPVDLDRIRRELEAISKIVGAGETMFGGTARAAMDAREVDFKLGQIVQLCGAAFRSPDALVQASETIIQVPVPELFQQLAKGRVTTKLGLLVSDIPADHLSEYAHEHAEDDIALPLHIVVAGVQPEELRKRTASQERDLGDRTLPNLFTPASIAKAAAEAAVQPPPAEEVAAAPAPAVEAPTEVPEVAASPDPESLVPVESVPAGNPPVVESEPVMAAPAIPEEPVFVEPPVVEDPVIQPEPAVAEASLPVEPAAELPSSAPEPVAQEEAVSGEGASEGFRVMLGGIDANTASAEEIHARWNGVGLKLAQRIVAKRAESGPFVDLYDLARVPGLRTKRFEQVTGLPWNAAYFRHREQVKALVGCAEGTLPDVRQVAVRLAEVSDFAGCMVIHEDGLLLAQCWDHPSADALGAFAPQMFKKINRYVKPLKLGEMNSICFFVGHQPITVVRSGQLYIAAMHRADKLTKKQITLVQALAMELGRRFERT